MSLPSGYKRLEYIQSDGNQWIDTGVMPESQDFSIYGKFQTTGDVSTSAADNWFVTIGHTKPSGTATYLQFGIWQAKWAIHLTNVVVNGVSASSSVVEITFGVSGNTVSLSGGATYSLSNSYFSSGSYRNQTICICDGKWKTYGSKIKKGGTLVRDYIPCQTTSGEIGLWDDVNSVFYGNAGTGAFTAGPVMEPPQAPASLQQLLSVRLAWSAVDGATSYNVYRDGTLLTNTTDTAYIDLTAAENTEYTYAVSAVGSGGESAKTTLTVYTKSGYFLYKPYVESATFQ